MEHRPVACVPAAAGDRGYKHSATHDHKRNAEINYRPDSKPGLRMWLMLAAMLRLDGEMNQLFVLSKQLAVFTRASWFMRNDRDDGGELSGSNLPDVQISYERIAIFFHGASDFLRQM